MWAAGVRVSNNIVLLQKNESKLQRQSKWQFHSAVNIQSFKSSYTAFDIKNSSRTW
jgi:hypothetical protein